MPDTKLLPKLIERLITHTSEGKIDWTETASEDDFQAPVAQNVVTVSRSRNSENWDAWDYRIAVADRNGALLDEARDGDFGPNVNIAKRTPYEALSSLYAAARRSARKVDQALADMIASLDSLKS